MLNPVNRKAPPSNDDLSQKVQVDVDSAHSSSVEDVSQFYGNLTHFSSVKSYKRSSVKSLMK